MEHCSDQIYECLQQSQNKLHINLFCQFPLLFLHFFRVLWFNEENAQVGFAWLTPTHGTCISQTRYKIQQCEHAIFETCVL
jgi:hypothetical protein